LPSIFAFVFLVFLTTFDCSLLGGRGLALLRHLGGILLLNYSLMKWTEVGFLVIYATLAVTITPDLADLFVKSF
jgi:hypothetical protein